MPGRILFLQRVFPPAPGAAGEMLFQLAEFLGNRSWQVEVVCTGNLPDPPISSSGPITVRRVAAAYSRRNLLARALSIYRVRNALESAARQCSRPDLVVSLTDPPGLAISGARVARHHGARHVHWSQDVYPEIAWQLGVLSRWNPAAIRMLRQSRRALREADAVISIGQCMTRLLERRGIDPARIHTIANWAPVPPPTTADPDSLRHRLNLDDRPVALYAGNLGQAHEFETLLSAAAQTPGWNWILAGEGPRSEEINRWLAAHPAAAVHRLPRQSSEDYAALKSLAAVHCVTLQPGIAGSLVPSKLYTALQVGKPLFYIGPAGNDAHSLAADAGASIRNGNVSGAVAVLNDWLRDPRRLEAAARRARALAGEFSLDRRAGEMETRFAALLTK